MRKPPPGSTSRGTRCEGARGEEVGAARAGVVLAGCWVLLGRLSGQADLVVGTPAAARRHIAFARLVGFFIEVLPLRVTVDEAASFTDLARACSDELLAALAHPAAPLDQIVAALAVRRDPATPPLVQVL